MEMLLYVSFALVFSIIGGKLVNRLRLPSVVGYLVAGLILGPSFLNIFSMERLAELDVFTGLALSIVAFIIGSEMKISTFKKMGAGIGVITLLESFGAFFVVATGVYLLTGKLYLALVFGALAPASAPTGTVAVLKECKAKGRLTNALYTVVGLDDGLAIIIFSFAVALAKLLLTGGAISAATVLRGPSFEILGAIALGCLGGIITGYSTRKISSEEASLAVCLGGILLCAGVAVHFHLSLIIANLSLGCVFVNAFPLANKKAYKAIDFISLPVYMVFFFIAGGTLQISLLPSMGILGLVYVLCRSAGLIGGAYIGATLSKETPVIRKYLGFGILSQAGVAIGLAVLAAEEFGSLGQEGASLSTMVVNTIAATTILFEIIGPIGTRFAITRAGELNANITEKDLIKTYKVRDVLDDSVPTIPPDMSLKQVVEIIGQSDSLYYPVVDTREKLVGAITMEGIRKTFNVQDLSNWLVAVDIMEPVTKSVIPEMSLDEAMERSTRCNLDYFPVVSLTDDEKYLGIMDCRAVNRLLSAKVLERQRSQKQAPQEIAA